MRGLSNHEFAMLVSGEMAAPGALACAVLMREEGRSPPHPLGLILAIWLFFAKPKRPSHDRL